jgi:hypothetical protein
MLAIGRALMTNPSLLILDEATEGHVAAREESGGCPPSCATGPPFRRSQMCRPAGEAGRAPPSERGRSPGRRLGRASPPTAVCGSAISASRVKPQ